MLERLEHPNGVVTYRSSLLSVPHAFTTRRGGVSLPPYDTLNLGVLTKGEGDANLHVAENYRRLRRALGVERRVRVEARQVHGGEVWSPPRMPVKLRDAPCADALVTDRPDHLLVIRVADCVPILLSAPGGEAVAAVHAGWRGVAAGVILNAVEAMPCEPGALAAVIGPCISVEHFEVGPEVVEAFNEVGLGETVDHSTHARPHIDLRRAARHQLAAAGVRNERIDAAAGCTYRDEVEFFSHRRDVTHRGLPATGRMAAVITCS